MPPLPLKPVPAALGACRKALLSHQTRSLSTLPVAILAAPRTRCLANLPERCRPRTPPSAAHPRRTLASHRGYHSYDHPAPAGPFSETERTILAAASKHVPEVGFSQDALALGARDSGYLDISTNLLPDGIFSLIQWHLVSQREALSARSQALFGLGEAAALMPVSEKAEALTWERLVGNAPTIHRWQEALAVMAQPSYIPASFKELARLVDEIWFLAGDKAVDPTWYTKRATLSAIYTTTELFMTADKSPDFQETRQFLRRRFQEANDLGGTVNSVGQWMGFTATAGLNVLRSKGLNV